MIKSIGTARMHGARSPEQLITIHRETLERVSQAQGIEIEPHTITDPIYAYINHGIWVLLCECMAGVYVHPEWPEARCMGCGAVYTNVQVPGIVERVMIEEALLKRPLSANRNWRTGETVADLEAENVLHGVRGGRP